MPLQPHTHQQVRVEFILFLLSGIYSVNSMLQSLWSKSLTAYVQILAYLISLCDIGQTIDPFWDVPFPSAHHS